MIKNNNIAVIGAGGWGSAISAIIGGKGIDVSLWAREEDVAEEINRHHLNSVFLPGVTLPETITAFNQLEDLLQKADTLVLAVPSYAARSVCEEISKLCPHEISIVSATKGFDPTSQMRITEVIRDAIPQARRRIAVLSGPNHAEEVGRKIPSATVIASENKELAENLQSIFMTDFFRVYTNPDVLGVEIGGALKNIIALDAGASDGLGFGDNTRAALITRGLAEMTRLGIAMGANAHTFSGLSGIGDLLATCSSTHSRNRKFGFEIAMGKTVEEILSNTKTVAEGVHAVKTTISLSKNYGVTMPLCEVTNNVLYHGFDLRESIIQLMQRGAKEEI